MEAQHVSEHPRGNCRVYGSAARAVTTKTPYLNENRYGFSLSGGAGDNLIKKRLHGVQRAAGDVVRGSKLRGVVGQKHVIKLVYSHIDRIITGSAVPVKETLKLTAGDELRAQYFCERRELGVINIGGAGVITIDGKEYNVAHKEGMYIGMGSKDISFASENADAPAKF